MPKTIPTLCGSMMKDPFTLGVRIHTAAYRALGLDYTFVCFGVDDVKATIAAVRTLGIRGLNVSMPYKQDVMAFLDHIDEGATHIGAVNTINNVNGVLTGFNTDWIGAVRALEERTLLAGRKLALLGAGGAARAIAYGTRRAGAIVTVFNRSAAMGRALSEAFDIEYGGTLDALDADRFSIVVNATSAGHGASGINPAAGKLARHLLVMDIVFVPTLTPLIREAQALGCETIDGTRMLVHQACGQVELYTGCARAPFGAMEAALLAELKRSGGG